MTSNLTSEYFSCSYERTILKIIASNEIIQLTEKLFQDLCQYANLVLVAEQKMSVHSLCYKREPADSFQAK